MRRLPWLALLLCVVFLTPAPARAEEPPLANALGFGLGETTGTGILYQRVLGAGWRGRASFGVIPLFDPYSTTMVFTGAGLQRDLLSIGSVRTYAVLGGMYKKPSINSYHLSIDPALGIQWGPGLLEIGTSFWRSYRWNVDDGIPRYIEWGLSLAVGCGMVWAF